jgi:hypothetical protein
MGMGAKGSFRAEDIRTVSDALDIAEDRTGGFYKVSFDQWKKCRYGVKTLSYLNPHEIAPDPAFALLNKYTDQGDAYHPRAWKRDFYSICLQDHQILKAMERDGNLDLLPLMVYVFTHELIHIVRFCNFAQRFEVNGEGREREEKIVHAMTYDVLSSLSLKNLDYVLDVYREHGICSLAACG